MYGRVIRIKKGFDINLAGKAAPSIAPVEQVDTFAVKPTDFQGIYLAKPLVQKGDNVEAGTPLFYDKRQSTVMYTSPVSGEIVEIKRGAKRKLMQITILADKKITHIQYKKYSISDINKASIEEVKEVMLKAGVWPNLIQRPFGITANPDATPKSIHISTFDTHPLAPDYGFLFKNQDDFFKAGLDILKKFVIGSNIYLHIHADKEISSFFSHVEDVQITRFLGPHPAGCVGVQIHHTDPINKGDVVWTINPFGVIQIGKLFLQGIHDASRIVALVGPEVKKPQYYQTYTGASVKKIIRNNLVKDEVRVVSGNLLTGTHIGKEGHIGYFDHQVTVVSKEEERRLLGWFTPTLNKLSFHKAFGLLSFLRYDKEFMANTNTNGESRAFVQTGAFEKVTPMDILPTYLLKSIIAEDIDEMEALGIYEVIEEDLALCEFIDVSKHNIQQILREGIELIRNS